jgi:hypothetical protein
MDAAPYDDKQRKEFLAAYIEAALWSSTTEDGTPLDQLDEVRAFHQNVDALAPATQRKMALDCAEFFMRTMDDLVQVGDPSQHGHDFWLTRNHHGAGFWDRGYPQDIDVRLTDEAHLAGECDLYLGEDHLIHAMDDES